MALVAATIADRGVEPKPYLVQKIVASDGSTIANTTPQTLGRPIKATTAAELNQMMQLVVQGGTGTNAQIPGVPGAGKTGTAELGLGNLYDAWFVCFAPANNPRGNFHCCKLYAWCPRCTTSSEVSHRSLRGHSGTLA
jgi:peptidoglycan glycosyltransferase